MEESLQQQLSHSLDLFVSDAFVESLESEVLKKLKGVFVLKKLESVKNKSSRFVYLSLSEERESFKERFPLALACSLDSFEKDCFFIDLDDSEQASGILGFLKSLFEREEEKEPLTSGYKNLTRVLNSSLKESSEPNQREKALELFLSDPEDLFEETNFQKFLKSIKKIINPLKVFKTIGVCSSDEVSEYLEKKAFVVPILFSEQEDFLYVTKDKADDQYFFFCFSLFYQWIEKYYRVHHHRLSLEFKKTLWEEALHYIPSPVSLLSREGELLKYNDKFFKLGVLPSQCMSLKDGDSIEIGDDVFSLKRKEVETQAGKTAYLFLFFKADSKRKDKQSLNTMTSKDLGIITSSIAHELNNPLAGVLACIVLLELEDWEKEEEQALAEMKSTAMRCKDLIRIFLGFSKAKSSYQDFGEIKIGLERALDLLRFRMIEDETMIEIQEENESCESFGVSLSIPISTMFFYLLLSEMITQFNHLKLISGKSEKSIDLVINQNHKNFILKFPSELDMSRAMKQSKLLSYLVDSLGLESQFDNGELSLKTWMLV